MRFSPQKRFPHVSPYGRMYLSSSRAVQQVSFFIKHHLTRGGEQLLLTLDASAATTVDSEALLTPTLCAKHHRLDPVKLSSFLCSE